MAKRINAVLEAAIDEGYREMITEIVKQAMKDYRKALKIYKQDMDDMWALMDVVSIEGFFKSPWFTALTGVEGKVIIERFRMEFLGEQSDRKEVRCNGCCIYDR